MNNKLSISEKNIGIWIDQEKAYLIKLEGDQESVIEKIDSDIELRERVAGEKETITHFGEYMVGEREKKQRRQQQERTKYFKNIMNHLQDANGIYIFGPAETKHEMAKAIQKVPHLREKLIAVENSDRLTFNQMKAKVKEIFLKK